MGLRETCGRCVAVCYERNPVIAKMLGLCPFLAVTDTAMDGVIFGGFFTFVLCLAGVAVPLLRYVVATTLRPLLYPLALSIIVAAGAASRGWSADPGRGAQAWHCRLPRPFRRRPLVGVDEDHAGRGVPKTPQACAGA